MNEPTSLGPFSYQKRSPGVIKKHNLKQIKPTLFHFYSFTLLKSPKLLANDAGKGRPDHRPGQHLLTAARNEEVNVLDVAIELRHDVGHLAVGENPLQVVKGVDPREAAYFAVLDVAGEAVIATTLNVQRHQIEAEALARYLKEVVGDLATEEVVN